MYVSLLPLAVRDSETPPGMYADGASTLGVLCWRFKRQLQMHGTLTTTAAVKQTRLLLR